MLQHSRSSSSQKEPIDINKLADEYVRLAYHGFRVKDCLVLNLVDSFLSYPQRDKIAVFAKNLSYFLL
jgi:hypothetical protein